MIVGTGMDQRDDDAWLSALLKDQRHVEDAGFSAAVIAALPRRRRRAIGRREFLLLTSAVLAGVAGLSGVAGVSSALDRVAHEPLPAVAIGLVAVLTLWGAAAAAASET